MSLVCTATSSTGLAPSTGPPESSAPELLAKARRCTESMAGTSGRDTGGEKTEYAKYTREQRLYQPDRWVSQQRHRCVLGLIKISTRDTLDALLTEKRIGAYVGIDPTASSMHVGHLLPLMVLYWLYIHGYHAVSLVGGQTDMRNAGG